MSTPTPTSNLYIWPWRSYKHHNTKEWKEQDAKRKQDIIDRRYTKTKICKAKHKTSKAKKEKKAKCDSPEAKKAKRAEYNRTTAKNHKEKINDDFKIFHEAGNAKNNPILHPLIRERCEKWFTKEQWDTVLDFIKFNNENTDEDYTNYENCFIKKIYQYVNNKFLTPNQIAGYAKYKLTQKKIIQKV